jgi:hypothetical protein
MIEVVCHEALETKWCAELCRLILDDSNECFRMSDLLT